MRFSFLLIPFVLMACTYDTWETTEDTPTKQVFLHNNLQTDTSQTSIPLEEILDGGPGKDGIPAIYDPSFLSIRTGREQMSYLTDESEGIVVEIDGVARWYPYNILNWHEIVNDEIGDTSFSVTFCPLCGSAIVFDRVIDGVEVRFGVSGKLYNSNLLMYDDVTESLWSQSRGEAVVGDYLGTELRILESDVISLAKFTELYPDGVILSDDTGEHRAYARIPYGDYTSNEILYFPVDHEDVRLPRKELLYIINDGDLSVAFVRDTLREAGTATLQASNGRTYVAELSDGQIIVTENGERIPGYTEMWFSWITHNQNSKDIWGIE